MLSFPVSYILLQSLGHSVYMSTGSKVTFSLAIGALGWGMWDDGNSSRDQWKASSSTEIHGNSYHGLSGFLYSRVWKHSNVILTFFLFLRLAGFAFEQRSVFSRSSISTRTCENGLLAICSISTNNLWTTKCILHILHIKLSNIIVLYYKYPRNKGSNSEQSLKTLKSMTVMGSIYSSLLEWNKDPALTLIRWEAMPWLRQSVVSLSLWRPRFDPRTVYAGFVVNKGTVGQGFLWAFQFYMLYGSDNGYVIQTRWAYGLLTLHVLKFSTLCFRDRISPYLQKLLLQKQMLLYNIYLQCD